MAPIIPKLFWNNLPRPIYVWMMYLLGASLLEVMYSWYIINHSGVTLRYTLLHDPNNSVQYM